MWYLSHISIKYNSVSYIYILYYNQFYNIIEITVYRSTNHGKYFFISQVNYIRILINMPHNNNTIDLVD